MKFRLKKTYPGSPKINTEVAYDKCHGWVYQNLIETKLECPEPHAKEWSVALFQTYSEFWEQLCDICGNPIKTGENIKFSNINCICKEKNYQILEFRRGNEWACWEEENQFFIPSFNLTLSFTEEELLKNRSPINAIWPTAAKIRKVRRLSDGEIFTVGDKFKNRASSVTYEITLFRIVNNELIIDGRCLESYITTGISGCIKQTPLFATEDGVGIFLGVSCYGVHKTTMLYSGKHVWQKEEHYNHGYLVKKFLFFSTEIAAKKYVKENKKPLFITEDGKEIFEDQPFYVTHLFERDIDCLKANSTTDQKVAKERDYHYFATKANAEEWIVMNRQCLSIKDVATIYISADKYNPNSPNNQAARLKNLVKSRI